MKKTSVAVMTRYGFPAVQSGGTVRSVKSFADSFSSSLDISVYSLNKDIHSQKELQGVVPGKLVPLRGWHSMHCNRGVVGYLSLLMLALRKKPDYLYLNSFFDVFFSILPYLIFRIFLARTKIVLAPRGEFSVLALKIKKRRKLFFLKFVSFFNIYKNITWQASTELEKVQIINAKITKKPRVLIASDMVDLPVDREFDEAFFRNKIMTSLKSNVISLCYLSRVTPIKNLEFCVEVLMHVEASVNFNIYGVIEDDQYYARVSNKISLLPKNINVRFFGPVSRDQLESTFNKNCLFFLPTLGENFGHAIFESLCFGLPVLVSNATPWRDLETHGCGWDISLECIEDYVKAIERFAQLTLDERIAMSRCANEFVKIRYSKSAVFEQNKGLFPGLETVKGRGVT
ncbi:glycosyltransferase [Alphaproteobacteria bacterium]|nr:glycosyltransferase [Alphaproteobacteria bacterium]